MNLNTQIQFADFYSKFLNETHTMSDIGLLIQRIRENKHDISDDAAKILLQIPLCVLENQSEIKNEVLWAKSNGSYFSGNYAQEPFYSKFNSCTFDLNTIIECLMDIMSDDSKLKSDFHLRNPEVTLCHDASVKVYSSFKESGKIYARIMEEAFTL